MALNLWTIGGKPSSYNPLSGNQLVSLSFKPYVLSFYASSVSSAVLKVTNNYATNDITQNVNLTPNRTFYKFSFTNTGNNNLLIQDLNVKGDIIIDSISLVQAPLPKLTINGVDGFNSGKWTVNQYATVVDDTTLSLVSPVINAHSILKLNLIPGTTYTLNGQTNGSMFIEHFSDFSGSGSMVGNDYGTAIPRSFTVPLTAGSTKIILTNGGGGNNLNTLVTFKQPSVNLGSIPAPYEKKRGDKMVLPTPKKNLFNISDIKKSNVSLSGGTFADVSGFYGFANGLHFPDNSVSQYAYLYPSGLSTTKTYTLSVFVQMDDGSSPVCQDSSIGDFVFVIGGIVSSSYTITSLGNGVYRVSGYVVNPALVVPNTGVLKRTTFTNKGFTVSGWQLEEGTTATPFTPYAVQVNKKPQRTNLANKGVYLTNGATIDAGTFLNTALQGSNQVTVDIMFKIDSLIGSSGTWYWLFTANDNSGPTKGFFIANRGMSDGTISWCCMGVQLDSSLKLTTGTWYRLTATFNSGVMNIYINGVLQGTAINAITSISMGTFVTGINHANYYGSPYANASYKFVRVYSQALTPNQIDSNVNVSILNYDFTNPRNIVGNTVMTNAQNLLPSFDSGLWTINSNAQVLGKDVLHLNATALNQDSTVTVPVLPNTNYKLTSAFQLANNAFIGGQLTGSNYQWVQNNTREINFTTASNQTSITIIMRSLVAGSFDFIRPQLYQLNGTEGTINGNPIQQNKAAKRKLYAQR